ncbi:universal stress protein [Wenzhouxiangella marina]|uniref:Uncharacterized protein n=1 Tax=Wenzhouxiangella marina TaxID=1579979 RepID=A0A0K0XTD1_9GAMM|nr:universal stress protein [Wenzhouxiangella marina]AKS40915.1 hypothetical protein WM2015_533 [Wenzhouxiangella marina]MBB6087789.1 hypothetical protein [Wenzhouxiangella marina]
MAPEPEAALAGGRIVVLFDGSPGSQAALLQGLAMAQAQQRELVALYLEEAAQIAAAGLAVAGEVGAVSGQLRPLNAEAQAQALRIRRRRAQACLDHLMGGPGHSLALDVRQGEAVGVLEALLGPEDCVVAGRAGFATRHPGRLGRLARRLLSQLLRPTLLASTAGQNLPGPMVLVLDSEAGVERLLQQALRQARASRRDLIVLADPDLDGLDALNTALAEQGMQLHLARIRGPLSLLKWLQDLGGAQLLLDRGSPLLARMLNEQWLINLDRPLLILGA